MTQEQSLYLLIFIFQNPSGFSDVIDKALTITLNSECLEVLIILLKFIYHKCCLDNSDEIKLSIKKILHGENDDSNNVFVKVLRNRRLLVVQSLLLCIAFEIHESTEAFENYLKEQFDSDDQLLEEATRIIKKYVTLKKDGFYGAKILSMCPTHIHWMALFNDVKSVEVPYSHKHVSISDTHCY